MFKQPSASVNVTVNKVFRLVSFGIYSHVYYTITQLTVSGT